MKFSYKQIIHQVNVVLCCITCGKIEIHRLKKSIENWKTTKLQNRAACVVTNSSYGDPSGLLIWSIDDLINQETKAIKLKSFNNLKPQYLVLLFRNNSHSSSHDLRHSDLISNINRKSRKGQKCFSHRGTQKCNSLPP